MPDIIKYVRVHVALVERTSKEYDGRPACRNDFHPRQRHHWHLLIEKDGYPRDWRKWHQCHTIETRAWQRIDGDRGIPEDFEDFPFVASAETLRIVPHSIVHVASIDASRRDFLIQKLENLSALVDKQRERGETCRYFIEGVLCYLHNNLHHFGIIYPEKVPPFPRNLDRAVRKYVDLNIIEDYTTERAFRPLPPPPPQPAQLPSRLKSKRSIFGIRPSDKERSMSMSRLNSVSQQKLQISKPQPLDPSQYPTSNEQLENRQSRGEARAPMSKFQPEPSPSSNNRILRIGGSPERDESTRHLPYRRASENPQSHRQRMAESLSNIVKRKSSPT